MFVLVKDKKSGRLNFRTSEEIERMVKELATHTTRSPSEMAEHLIKIGHITYEVFGSPDNVQKVREELEAYGEARRKVK